MLQKGKHVFFRGFRCIFLINQYVSWHLKYSKELSDQLMSRIAYLRCRVQLIRREQAHIQHPDRIKFVYLSIQGKLSPFSLLSSLRVVCLQYFMIQNRQFGPWLSRQMISLTFLQKLFLVTQLWFGSFLFHLSTFRTLTSILPVKQCPF